jgi:hypothetical protein
MRNKRAKGSRLGAASCPTVLKPLAEGVMLNTTCLSGKC